MESPYILISIKLATEQLFKEGKITNGEHYKTMHLAKKAESLRNEFIETTEELDEAMNEMHQAMHDRQAEQEEKQILTTN